MSLFKTSSHESTYESVPIADTSPDSAAEANQPIEQKEKEKNFDISEWETFDLSSLDTKGELYTEFKKYEQLIKKHIERLLEREPGKQLLPQILELDAYINRNQNALRQNPLTASSAWDTKANWYPQRQLYPLMEKISNLYRNDVPSLLYQPSPTHLSLDPELRRINSKFNRQWSRPAMNRIKSTMFDRECTKYWLKNEDILSVIAAIIPHLPVYRHPLSDKDASMAQPISSVYLDDEDYKCYHERINKQEDARVVRMRWYGEDTDTIFVERKLHKKGDAQSLKERFRIKEADIVEFMSGREHEFDAKINKGAAMQTLHREVCEMIQIFELAPKTRSVYNRISFQLGHTNAIRISLDTDLRFIREKPCLLDRYEWYTKEADIHKCDVERFPLNVLEVKLCGQYIHDPPQWIRDLMDSDLLIKCSQFSKYAHSIYSFHANEIYITPKWIEMYPQYFGETEQELRVKNAEETKTEAMMEVPRNQCMCCGKGKKAKSDEKKKVVNAKIYFSNERQFLREFKAAVFMGSAGLTIRSVHAHPDESASLVLIISSLFMLVWAVVIFYRRSYVLLKRQQVVHDLYGPAVFVIVMIVAMGTIALSGVAI